MLPVSKLCALVLVEKVRVNFGNKKSWYIDSIWWLTDCEEGFSHDENNKACANDEKFTSTRKESSMMIKSFKDQVLIRNINLWRN